MCSVFQGTKETVIQQLKEGRYMFAHNAIMIPKAVLVPGGRQDDKQWCSETTPAEYQRGHY